jgi:glycerophosphoryl diester phosphodiesterase
MIADRVRAFAHRGGGAEAPENSLAAFTRAAALGFLDMETDVRGTVDGVAVVHHDPRLERTTDARGAISDLTWSEVARARIHGYEPICRLEILLEALPNCRFTIDAKDAAAVPALLKVLHGRRDLDRITVGSFSHRRLSEIRRNSPVVTSASPREVLTTTAAIRSGRRPAIAARYLAVPPHIGRLRLLDEHFVNRAQAADLEVHVWTIDDVDRMHELLDLGVDGLMTDRPSVLKEVLLARGAW